MGEFRCRPGECVKCCADTAIPVTLGDLYRAVRYEQSLGRTKTLYDVFDERCSGWMLVPNQRSRYPSVIPQSRKPCYNLGTEDKVCRVHDKAQYVTCRTWPEELIMKLPDGALDFMDSKQSGFASEIECLKGVEVGAAREKELLKIVSLRSRELDITGLTLNAPWQPAVRSYNSSELEQAKPELKNRMRLLCGQSYAAALWVNVSQTQKEYMELFGVEEPDYTRPPSFETIDGRGNVILRWTAIPHLNRAQRRAREREQRRER